MRRELINLWLPWNDLVIPRTSDLTLDTIQIIDYKFHSIKALPQNEARITLFVRQP